MGIQPHAIGDDDPALCRLMPEQLRVAPVAAVPFRAVRLRMHNDGIDIAHDRVAKAAIGRIREAVAAGAVGEGRDDRLLLADLFAKRVVHVHHRSAGEAIRVRHAGIAIHVLRAARAQRAGSLPPVHQILAHRMAPIPASEARLHRIALPREMIEPVRIDHAVRIIIPPLNLAEVKLRTPAFLVNRLRVPHVIATLHPAQNLRPTSHRRTACDAQDRVLALKLLHVEKRPEPYIVHLARKNPTHPMNEHPVHGHLQKT